MTGENNQPQDQQPFLQILDEYAHWFMQVLQAVFYVHAPGASPPSFPVSFLHWLRHAEEQGPGMAARMAPIETLHADMMHMAGQLIAGAESSNEAPPFADFEKMTRAYQGFVSAIGRLERENAPGHTGGDALTGLRPVEHMKDDLATEMERLDRKGKPFCLTLVRIDNFPFITENLHADQRESCIRAVAQMIRKSIRSFDEAYWLEDGHFMISLKQTDMAGGIQALERLRREAAEQNVSYEADGRAVPLTLSSCVAEPVPGQDLDGLLKHLKSDLARLGAEQGAVLEYADISPLERYIKELQS